MNPIRRLVHSALAVLVLLAAACSSAARKFDTDISGVSTFSFGKDAPISADPIEDKIIKVMEAKGYTYTHGDDTGIVFRWDSSEGNPFHNHRKVWATYGGKPVMAAEAENKGFGTLVAPEAAQSGLTDSLVRAVEKNFPNRQQSK